jgi:hypothetical protein
MPDVAARAPHAFAVTLWPWLVEICSELSDEEGGGGRCYRPDRSRSMVPIDFGEEDGPRQVNGLVAAVAHALTLWATRDPDDFLGFAAREAAASDTMLPQLLLMRGAAAAAPARPEMVPGIRTGG